MNWVNYVEKSLIFFPVQEVAELESLCAFLTRCGSLQLAEETAQTLPHPHLRWQKKGLCQNCNKEWLKEFSRLIEFLNGSTVSLQRHLPWGGDPEEKHFPDIDRCDGGRWFANSSGMNVFPLLSLNGFPKFTKRRARTRA